VGIVDRAALECGERLPHDDMMRKERARPAAA